MKTIFAFVMIFFLVEYMIPSTTGQLMCVCTFNITQNCPSNWGCLLLSNTRCTRSSCSLPKICFCNWRKRQLNVTDGRFYLPCPPISTKLWPIC